MKRTALLILTLLYTLSSLGMSVERFYCCGKLANTTYAIGDSGNKEVKAAKADNCCKTVKTTFKVKDNHFSAKTVLDFKNSVAVIAPVFFVPVAPERAESPVMNVYDSQAPPVHRNPLYLLYANFRI
ncbi:hypothetical protein C8P68_102568 [Mucilaginibacter yixingensis]|uniref:Uncharacterized protein n=1 Tax=Mucilaginibacter yixingensis TaxID=1295612 RepID=A0A2T5JD93_9SPHI|nr:hypothetical protein [Mucilaginibacter yixingensis]PTQ99738.1 hypothetical protein C8P68_102568 [Mucilaginibacter yixingensis]